MSRFAGVAGRDVGSSISAVRARTEPSLLEQLAGNASDDDAYAPMPSSSCAVSSFDSPEVLAMGDHGPDDDDDGEGSDSEHAVPSGAGGQAAELLQDQEGAERMYKDLEFLRASGIDETSSAFQGHLHAFLEAAGGLFSRTAGTLPSARLAAQRTGSGGHGDERFDADSDDDDEEQGEDVLLSGAGATSAAVPSCPAREPALGESGDSNDEGASVEDNLLYGPDIDDEDAEWVRRNIERLAASGGGGSVVGDAPPAVASAVAGSAREAAGLAVPLGSVPTSGGSGSSPPPLPLPTIAVLSCPSCFTVVCYQCAAHPHLDDAFVASAAVHVRISGAEEGSGGEGGRLDVDADEPRMQHKRPRLVQPAVSSCDIESPLDEPLPDPAVLAGGDINAGSGAFLALRCAHCGEALGFREPERDRRDARFVFTHILAGDG
jgi:hypothetical protein